MRIAILVEGETELAFIPTLREFIRSRITDQKQMPKLAITSFRGRIPKGEKLKHQVRRLLERGSPNADAVIALTDVYTGTNPPDFLSAEDAKTKMRSWVGENQKFYPHAAQHDFEAWLVPYWNKILTRTGSNRKSPGNHPETINHTRPPSVVLSEVYRSGTKGNAYLKVREAQEILRGADLTIAANACPELKAFLNTILTLCNGTLLT